MTLCASLLGKSQSLPPCGARKNLRAARLLDFFDRYGCSTSLHPPLAVLGSASPSTATPSPSKIAQQIPVLLSQQNPLFMRTSPINSQFCKFSIKKSEILTSHMQKRGDFAVLVKGLFSPAKNSFPSAPLTELKLRVFRPHRSNRGAG